MSVGIRPADKTGFILQNSDTNETILAVRMFVINIIMCDQLNNFLIKLMVYMSRRVNIYWRTTRDLTDYISNTLGAVYVVTRHVIRVILLRFVTDCIVGHNFK